MAYSDFTLEDIEIKFGIKNKVKKLFSEQIISLEPTERLKEDLALAKDLPIKSEKARSELIVIPILLELRKRNKNYFTIYSGDTLVANKAQGLTGECDFILAKETKSFSINVPILSVVEAKKNDIETGIPQCAAQLIGARIFNKQRKKDINELYGCITTGQLWKFIKLEGQTLFVDKEIYYLKDIKKLLGVFQSVLDEMKAISA